MKNKLIIAGGTGYLGQTVIDFFKNDYDIVIITRKDTKSIKNINYINWNDDWQRLIDSDTIIINLAGKSINCLFTNSNKKELINSRIIATKAINKAIINAKTPPKLFINASGISIYKSNIDKRQDEINFEYGNGFLSELSKQWENEFYKTKTPKTRKVAVRLAPVLGKESHAIKPLKKIISLGLGGKQGNGKQYFSWIHQIDFVRAINYVIKNENLDGSLNLTSPKAITNLEFMQTFRKTMQIKIGVPTPSFLLHLSKYLNKVEPELILDSVNIYPKKLIDHGFIFEYNTIEKALKDILV